VVPLLTRRRFLTGLGCSAVAGAAGFGVGNLHGMRFNCRPQVSVLELA